MPVMITLNKIRAVSLYEDEWNKVRDAHKNLEMDTPFPLYDVLDSNGLGDTLQCFKVLPEHIEIPKRFTLWCARGVQHLMTDKRSVDALDVAERYLDGDATREELETAASYATYAARTATDAVVYAVIAFALTAADADVVVFHTALTASRAAADVTRQKQIDKLREMLDESDS
jgi:hypothetical protein